MKFNLKSVFASGLVAGLLINLSAIIIVPMVRNEIELVLESRGLPPLGNIAMLCFSMISFILGVFLVGLYAVVKDQLGVGIMTAVIVSLIFWFLTYFLSNVSLSVYGFKPIRLTVIGTAWGWGELLLASIVGSKLYTEIKQN